VHIDEGQDTWLIAGGCKVSASWRMVEREREAKKKGSLGRHRFNTERSSLDELNLEPSQNMSRLVPMHQEGVRGVQ